MRKEIFHSYNYSADIVFSILKDFERQGFTYEKPDKNGDIIVTMNDGEEIYFDMICHCMY